MMMVEIGPVEVSILTLSVAAVGAIIFCCCCCLLTPSYSTTRQGRNVPYGGKNLAALRVRAKQLLHEQEEFPEV